MLIIQNGYECDYEMKLFYKLYFDMNEDIYVYSNFEYKDKVINVYTEIIYILTISIMILILKIKRHSL